MPDTTSSRRRSGVLACFMLTGAVLPAGCRPAGPPAPPAAIITVDRATYDTAPRLSLVPGAVLCDTGSEDCDLGAEVSAVDDVHGGTMVWEFAKPIRRYDRAGRRMADLGRKGKGPGEYEIAVAAGQADGGITVLDISSLRLARFDASGNFRDFKPVRLPQTTRQVILLDGRLVVFSIQPMSDGGGSSFRAVQLAENGAADTLAQQPLPGYVSSAGRFQEMPALFGSVPRWAAAESGTVLFSSAQDYEVTSYQHGVAVKHLVVDHPARSVEQSEIDREAARMRAHSSGPLRAAVEDKIRRAAGTHPSITQLFAVPDGGILVRESPGVGDDSVRWSRFDSGWHLRGYFMTAEDARVLLIRSQQMLVQEQMLNGVRLQWYSVP